MIVRLWRTIVQPSRMAEYEKNEQDRSIPMFKQQEGCLGVLFLRSDGECFALSFWKDVASVEKLKISKSYLEASAFYSNSGMLVGEPSLRVFEVKGGYIVGADWLAFGSGDNPKIHIAARNVTQPKSQTAT